MTDILLDLHGLERRITIADTPYPGHRIYERAAPLALPTLDPATPTVLVSLERTANEYEFCGTVRNGLAVYVCTGCARCRQNDLLMARAPRGRDTAHVTPPPSRPWVLLPDESFFVHEWGMNDGERARVVSGSFSTVGSGSWCVTSGGRSPRCRCGVFGLRSPSGPGEPPG